MQVIRSGLGPLPFVKDKDEKEEGDEEPEEAPARASAPASNRPAVLPDGSYATQVCSYPGTPAAEIFLLKAVLLCVRRPKSAHELLQTSACSSGCLLPWKVQSR